ncbi:SAF domain-containing protein [Rhodococcus sp. X156]|uniref:SAF domain-containing protein n=1 Tax=Rhodococcus sp. X156 TaxID=2499145 RepID=UPI000FD9B07A|nr:SAF domain-containing protein [Rhodococcus sp. X156]
MANHTSGRRRPAARRPAPATRGPALVTRAEARAPQRRLRASNLAPLWRERLAELSRPGWARTAAVRRVVAALLVLLAGVLALRGDPGTAGTAVLVATRDLPPGHVLGDADLQVVQRPAQQLPAGALALASDATGRALAAAVRSGEQLTDVRLLGPALAVAATGDAATTAVPLRLPDADVADLLHPGDTVDVLGLGGARGAVTVVATDATVLSVPPADPKRRSEGRLVVLALPAEQAGAVAAASLSESLTITFH